MLLILAGVSISLVVGDNGVLTQATRSSDSTKMGQMREAMGLAISSCQTDYFNAYASNASATWTDYLSPAKLNAALQKQGYYLLETTNGTSVTTDNASPVGSYWVSETAPNKAGDRFLVTIGVDDGATASATTIKVTAWGNNLQGS